MIAVGQPEDQGVTDCDAVDKPSITREGGSSAFLPATTEMGDFRMDELHVTAIFPAIDGANLDAFKALIAEGIAKTRSEPGNLQYDWYFNDDQTKCFVRECYADSDAVLAHMGNMGDTLGQLVELGGGLEIDMFGNPSAALVEAAAELAPNVYPFHAGK